MHVMRFVNRLARRTIRDWCPPIFKRVLARTFFSPRPTEPTFSGDFATWEDAVAVGGTYDSEAVFEKTAQSVLMIRDGKGLYERDSVIFHEHDPLFPWPLLANLLSCALNHGGQLNVVDFGGAIGSTYFQCKPFLHAVKELNWTVLDQPKQVAFGQQHLTTEQLRFVSSMDELNPIAPYSILILSSVLQYLPNPMEQLNQLIALGFDYVLLDRTAFWDGDFDRISIQRVPSHIYQASYPAWFFSKTAFDSRLTDHFIRKSNWICGDRYSLDGLPVEHSGAFWSRKTTLNREGDSVQ
ncbi:methyltransferase, TIGR04325 family [Novipirellula sp.]|uniref:methyltransferase, TIGR04325 family n=1 Tax=Novipirellula sp. TaxID=2795430 RepID=UPI003566C960